jgi:hypothetical protein
MLWDPKNDLDVIGKDLWNAADRLRTVGWCRNLMHNGDGKECIAGALSYVLGIAKEGKYALPNKVIYSHPAWLRVQKYIPGGLER